MYSSEEKDFLIQYLNRTREELLAAVVGLSEGQATFKPAPESWSVSGVVEHLAIVEGFVDVRLQQLPSMPKDATTNFRDSDAVLLDRVVDRSRRISAPDRAQPTGQSLAKSVERLLTSRTRIADFLQSPPADFHEHHLPHPVFGGLDGHQWLVALAGHCDRHTRQIHEIKAAPGFPRQ